MNNLALTHWGTVTRLWGCPVVSAIKSIGGWSSISHVCLFRRGSGEVWCQVDPLSFMSGAIPKQFLPCVPGGRCHWECSYHKGLHLICNGFWIVGAYQSCIHMETRAQGSPEAYCFVTNGSYLFSSPVSCCNVAADRYVLSYYLF